MSVRNQYARNNFKVAPIPSTSNEITNARNAARRRNVYQVSVDSTNTKPRQIQNNYPTVRQPWNMSQPKNNPQRPNYTFQKETSDSDGVYGTQIYNDRTANRKFGSLSEKTRMKVIAARESRRDSLTFIAESKRKNKSPVRNKSKSESDVRQTEDTVRQATDDDEQADDDVKQYDDGVKHHRPSSARPESRWARRNGEDEEEWEEHSDSSDDSLNNTRDTDLTDSPRMIDYYITDEIEPEVTYVSSRPKTGHGRKNISEKNSVSVKQDLNKMKYDRPKSRVGNRSIPKWTGSHSLQAKQNKQPESRETIPYNPYIPYDNVRSHTNNNEVDYDIGINIFYPEVRNILHEADDINSQIDDIDKTVDPVVFFMQNDEPIPMRGEKKRPSLSKDTINQINSEKNSAQNQNKNIHGIQGNVQNKCHSAPEKIDRFHRNKNPSLQNTIPETNQRYSNSLRQDNIANVSHERGGKFINKSRSNMDANTQSKRIDYDIGKQLNRENVTVTQRRSLDIGEAKNQSFIYGRKPRKLQPLMASNSDE